MSRALKKGSKLTPERLEALQQDPANGYFIEAQVDKVKA